MVLAAILATTWNAILKSAQYGYDLNQQFYFQLMFSKVGNTMEELSPIKSYNLIV